MCVCKWDGDEVVSMCGAHQARAREMFVTHEAADAMEVNAFKAGYKAGVLSTVISEDALDAEYGDYLKRNEYGNESRYS